MAVIIGSATSVSVQFTGGVGTITDGFSSVDWSYSSNIQRLYTLGGGSSDCGVNEFAQVKGADVSISFSLYGGLSPAVSTCAPTVCQNSPASAIVNIVPGICGGVSVAPINQLVFFTNYSYNKDKTGYGTETWQGTCYIECDPTELESRQYCECAPTYVVLGLAEGTIEGEPTANLADLETLTGARLRTVSQPMTSSRGSVQQGALSTGEYMKVWHGTFQSIGNSQGWNCGIVGKASVNISTQPVFTGQ
jgi:hypothetical protein